MSAKPDITALRYFLAVAECANYSRAASTLRITQPAVSRQIQSLERSFGTRLFRREGRQFSLTETGLKLAEHAREIVGRMDALHGAIGTAAREPEGPLSLGVTSAINESFLADIMRRYREKYPRVLINAVLGNSDKLADALAAGELDVAVIYQHPHKGELELTPLMEVKLGLVAPSPQAFPISASLQGKKSIRLQLAAAMPLILPRRGQIMRELIEQACVRLKIKPCVVVETDSLALTKALVKSGQGFMLGAHGTVFEEIEQGSMLHIPIRSPALPWRISVAVRRGGPMTLAVKTMLSELSDAIRASAADPRSHGSLIEQEM